MATLNSNVVPISIIGNDLKQYNYNLQPECGLFEKLGENRWKLVAFQIDDAQFWYKEAHHTPASAAHKIKKAAEVAAPGIGLRFGLIGVIVGMGTAFLIEQFPTDAGSTIEEGFYRGGHLIYHGHVIIE